jgi:hypothetical protein
MNVARKDGGVLVPYARSNYLFEAQMTPEEARIDLERKRIDLEERKFRHSAEYDEKKLLADKSAKTWAQISTFIPIVVIVIGFNLNLALDSAKLSNSARSESLVRRVQFVDRQLAELYYPIMLRLEKDSAVWPLSGQLSKQNRAATSPEFSRDIENSVLIPNHEEIISIIAAHFNLLKNADEHIDTAPLISAINQYQRHVAVYRALRKLNIYLISVEPQLRSWLLCAKATLDTPNRLSWRGGAWATSRAA